MLLSRISVGGVKSDAPRPHLRKLKCMHKKLGERSLILNDQNISVKIYRFLSFVNNESVVCDYIYFIFVIIGTVIRRIHNYIK